MRAASLCAYSAEKSFITEQCRAVCGPPGIAFSRERSWRKTAFAALVSCGNIRDELLSSNPAGLPPPSVREALAKPKALHLSQKLFRCERLPLRGSCRHQATGGVFSAQQVKAHDEHTGAHGSLQLVAQHAGEDEQHHHAAARADKAADETDEHSAHKGLDRTLFCADALHGFLGGHHWAHNKLDAQQEGHEHREASHGGRGHSAGHPAANYREQQHAGQHDQAVFDIQILVFVVGIGGHRAGQHIRRQGNAHRHIGVHVQEGDEHGADDCRRAHTGKAGTKAGPHAGKKVTRTVTNTFILCVLL